MPDAPAESKKPVTSFVERWLPGVHKLTQYDRSWFHPDLLAGVTLWAMLVPQALGYSVLAGMPGVNGLYAAFGAIVLYWIWGSSKMNSTSDRNRPWQS